MLFCAIASFGGYFHAYQLLYMRSLFFLSLFAIANSLFAQRVETVASHPKIVDGLHIDSGGNVYTTSGGLVGGVEIGKFNPSTNVYNPFFANGFFGPIDIDQYRDSLLVVTNFDNNTVARYNLNSGLTTTIASGLDAPAGIAIDSNDNIYITEFGVPSTFTGHTIHKITSQGLSYVYVDSSALLRPQAICFNHEGVLVVHSSQSLYKVNAADSSLVHWVNLGTGVGNMALRAQDSCIYACAGGNTDQIIKITAQGVVSVFAGSSDGYQDGDISVARFSNPLGIAISPTGDTIYVTEAGNAHRLRRILMDEITSRSVPLETEIEVYPNPAVEQIHIKNPNGKVLGILVVDVQGRVVHSETSEQTDIAFDIRRFDPGAYFVRIFDDRQLIVEKVLKY